MNSLLHRRTPLASLCLAVMALALAMRLAIPAGFMPTASADGSLPFELVICTGNGPMEAGKTDWPAPAGHEDSGASDAPCAFAGASPPAVAASHAEAVRVAFVAYAAPAARPWREAAPGRGLAAPPLPARGPPASFELI